MKKLFIFTILIFSALQIFAQQKELDQFNLERQHISRNGVKIIAGWSAANIIFGSIAAGHADKSVKYFHEMNAIFNGVTLGIAGLGYLTAKKEGSLSLAESIKKQHGIEKLFLFNAGLDIAYIAGGAYLQERAKTSIKNNYKYQGYGRSIMVQGGALLLFDGVMYFLHDCHGKKLNTIIDNINLSVTGDGIGLIINL